MKGSHRRTYTYWYWNNTMEFRYISIL